MDIIDNSRIAQNNKDPDNLLVLVIAIVAFIVYFYVMHH